MCTLNIFNMVVFFSQQSKEMKLKFWVRSHFVLFSCFKVCQDQAAEGPMKALGVPCEFCQLVGHKITQMDGSELQIAFLVVGNELGLFLKCITHDHQDQFY